MQSNQPRSSAKASSPSEVHDLVGPLVQVERPNRALEATLTSLLVDRFIADRENLFRTVAQFIYPQGDRMWLRLSPPYASELNSARNKICILIEQIETGLLGNTSPGLSASAPTPQQLLDDTIHPGLTALSEQIGRVFEVNRAIAQDCRWYATPQAPHLVLNDGVIVPREALDELAAKRDRITNGFVEGLTTWIASYQVGTFDPGKKEVTNLNRIVQAYCPGNTLVATEEKDYYVHTNPKMAEFLISNIEGVLDLASRRGAGRIVSATLNDPKFWLLNDREFDSSPQCEKLLEAWRHTPSIELKTEAPSHIVIRNEIPPELRAAVTQESSWINRELQVLERFGRAGGIYFESEVAPEQGEIQVRLFFPSLTSSELKSFPLPPRPEISITTAPEAPPGRTLDNSPVFFQRSVSTSAEEDHPYLISIPPQSLITERSRSLIGLLLPKLDETVLAAPGISLVQIQAPSQEFRAIQEDINFGRANVYFTGSRGKPEFNPSATTYSELWTDFPWEQDQSGPTSVPPLMSAPGGYSDSSITLCTDADTLLNHQDVWKKMLDLRQRANLGFIEMGPISHPDFEKLDQSHLRVPVELLRAVEMTLDRYYEEFALPKVELSIRPLDLQRRLTDHLTHSVQFSTDEGAFSRAIFDSKSGALILAPFQPSQIIESAFAVGAALTAIDDKKRGEFVPVLISLQNANIRTHEGLVYELIHALPRGTMEPEDYSEMVVDVVTRFLSDPLTSVEVKDGIRYIRFLGEVSDAIPADRSLTP